MTFDVIVVGARVAGAAAGLLLARAGLRVLVVDRAHFPSDTLSTHQIQLPGVARLARLGLLESLLDAGTPPTPQVRFQAGNAVIEGEFPSAEGVNMMISPRRTILDAMLVDAARAAGAEIREGCSLVELTHDGDRVTGIRLQDRRTRHTVTESAALVVGADGKHSAVARLVAATERRNSAAATFACYAYWDGLPVKGGEIYSGKGFAVGAWPTNEGLTLTYVAGPISEFDHVRRNPTAHVIATLDKVGSLGERARAAVQVGPTRGTKRPPQRGTRRPRTRMGARRRRWPRHGSHNRLWHRPCPSRRRAAVRGDHCGLGGATKLSRALSRYEKHRNRETYPALDWTLGLTRLRGINDMEERLFTAIGTDKREASAFFGMITWRGTDGIVLQPTAFDPTHRSQGFCAARTCSLAVNAGKPTG
jgi:2-polyprenyl-6-methoxyphenol hydroxylase-like FAD-dependent oxidoreductase